MNHFEENFYEDRRTVLGKWQRAIYAPRTRSDVSEHPDLSLERGSATKMLRQSGTSSWSVLDSSAIEVQLGTDCLVSVGALSLPQDSLLLLIKVASESSSKWLTTRPHQNMSKATSRQLVSRPAHARQCVSSWCPQASSWARCNVPRRRIPAPVVHATAASQGASFAFEAYVSFSPCTLDAATLAEWASLSLEAKGMKCLQQDSFSSGAVEVGAPPSLIEDFFSF